MRLVVYLFSGLCVLVSCGAPVSAQSAAPVETQRLSEADAVARFMASGPRIRTAAARIDETRAVQAERTLWPNPSITYARESVADATDTFLLARQELPLLGRRGPLRAAGERAVAAAQARARYETVQLQAAVRIAYTELVLAQEKEATLRSAISSLQQRVTILRAREEAGEGSPYDRMRGARALLDLEAELAGAAAARARAQGDLAAYFDRGVVPGTLVAADTLDAPITGPRTVQSLEQALAGRGDYQASEIAIAQFDAERIAATRLRLPTPTFTGGLKRSENVAATASGYQVSLDLAVPLFNRGQAGAAVATAARARAAAEAESWRTRIDAEVRAAETVLAIHQERAAHYRRSAAEIAEPLVAIGRVGYEEGELGILELLDAERQAIDARLKVLELAADARRAAIELDRVTGVELKP